MIRKLFRLWHNHTIGCARAFMVLLIPACFSYEYGFLYCNFMLIFTLIMKAGYEHKWNEEEK